MATWLSLEATARRLGISSRTIYSWIDRGWLHPIKPRETLLFSVDEVNRLLAEEGERRGLTVAPKDEG